MTRHPQRVINLVDNLSAINFGIWNSAISTAGALREKYGLKTEVWAPAIQEVHPSLEEAGVVLRSFSNETRQACLENWAKNLDANHDIIVSHGCWNWPTRFAFALHKRGFAWMYVPHGMLEPWSMAQKAWKKWPYFYFLEKPMAGHASVVRAVGGPELKNLKRHFGQAILIPNGVLAIEQVPEKPTERINVLFMARLHFKKGPLLLAKAWRNSPLNNNPAYWLHIAGPDEGELEALKTTLSDVSNATYHGSVYGNEKIHLLSEAHYYILPSLSEGFPTSVVEAMMYGAVPIITNGCNFPEALEASAAILVEPQAESIRAFLVNLRNGQVNREALQANAFHLAKTKYAIQSIAEAQRNAFEGMLNS